ncbi:3-methyl-2-oxobutanoate hydroxymethyltransferase [Actinomycetes bacterium]|nr:3-methyl-2-oxobutanoate hydroxymethyltransferase [Actinomycetes bacterium]
MGAEVTDTTNSKFVPEAQPRRATQDAPQIVASKGTQTPLVMVTAYDAPSARAVDAAGADMILVGDSVAMVVLGYENTLHVTTDDMVHHVAAVARTKPSALVVGDLPWLSYHVSIDDTVRNAAALVRAGAGAVKLEGGRKRLPAVEAILAAEIPVMGHLGLTPQSVHALGGYRVQGRELEAARAIVDDAIALADAGCFAVVLECVPDAVARLITDTVAIPTIGIGAGRHCDGQVLVFHDLLGLGQGPEPKFVRRYADLGDVAVSALAQFADDVRAGSFPSSKETYHAADSLPDELRSFGPVGDAEEPAPA